MFFLKENEEQCGHCVEILPVKNRNMIRCKLLASFYANKEGAASPKKQFFIYINT
jgi:hypothetical protein